MDATSKHILDQFDDRVEKSIQHLVEQLRTIRTGRASPALVETIRVDYYGTPTPIQQLAHISVPEPRQLLLKPFDQSVLKEMERSILRSDLGLTPSSDGKVLRLTLPPLSEEQRKKLVHKVRELAEECRVALRNERRDANKHGDVAAKDGKLSDDLNHDLHLEVQERLKKAESRVDEVLKKKTAEIMED
jgi:ribosome recycling factor